MKKDKTLIGNENIEKNIAELKESFTDEVLAKTLTTIRRRILDGGQFVIAVGTGSSDVNLSVRTASYAGKKWFVAYTSFEEELKSETGVMSGFLADIDQIMDMALKTYEVEGIILNPYGNMMTLNKEIIRVIRGSRKVE